jgi:hypothetical protein
MAASASLSTSSRSESTVAQAMPMLTAGTIPSILEFWIDSKIL